LVGAVKVAVPPPTTVTSKMLFVAEVTVWFWASWFLTVIFAPGATDAGIVNLKFLIVMSAGAVATALDAGPGAMDVDGAGAAGEDDGVDNWDKVLGAADDPQAVSPAISPVAAKVRRPDLMFMLCPF